MLSGGGRARRAPQRYDELDVPTACEAKAAQARNKARTRPAVLQCIHPCAVITGIRPYARYQQLRRVATSPPTPEGVEHKRLADLDACFGEVRRKGAAARRRRPVVQLVLFDYGPAVVEGQAVPHSAVRPPRSSSNAPSTQRGSRPAAGATAARRHRILS